MDTNKIIKSVLEENIVETKKELNDILMQKLSERLQAKFDEFAPMTFLDNVTEESIENSDEDELNEKRAEVANLLEKKKGKEEEEEEEEEDEEGEEEDEEEEMGEDGLVYEYGEEECENCNHENKAQEMNKKAFGKKGLSEDLKGKQHNLDVAPPKGKLTKADFDALRNNKAKKKK